MRISLVEREPQVGKQRKRRKKQRRTRTFDSSIARPQALPGPKTRTRRDPKKRTAAKQRVRARQTAAPAAPTIRAASWWRIALGRLVGIGAVLGAAGMLVYGSVNARFFVYHARVSGSRHIDATAVYRQAAIHEQNIFWIRPQEVAERVRQIDGVKTVQVRMDLPAEVSIQIQEREPVVMWRALAQQRDWWLDEDGWVVPYPGDATSPEMIFVIDSSDRQLEPGGKLKPAELVPSVRQLASAMPGTRIFFYDGDRELSFTQQVEGVQWPVYVGTSEDLPHKIQVLQVLNRYFQDNEIHPRYVDVRWADHPLYNVPSGQGMEESE